MFFYVERSGSVCSTWYGLPLKLFSDITPHIHIHSVSPRHMHTPPPIQYTWQGTHSSWSPGWAPCWWGSRVVPWSWRADPGTAAPRGGAASRRPTAAPHCPERSPAQRRQGGYIYIHLLYTHTHTHTHYAHVTLKSGEWVCVCVYVWLQSNMCIVS